MTISVTPNRARIGRTIAYLLIAVGIGTVLHPWLFRPGVPLTIRGENVPEINYIWMIRNLIADGHAFSAWLAKPLAGEPVLVHIAYPFYWTIAGFTWLVDLPVETVYRYLIFGLLAFGAIAVAEYMYLLTGSWTAAAVAGLVSALTPGRFNAIEGLYLQLSWVFMLWTLWAYERGFARTRTPTVRSAVLVGLLGGLMLWSSIQIPLMTALPLAMYVLVREWQTVGRWNDPQSRFFLVWIRDRWRAWLTASGIALGIALSYYGPTLVNFREIGFSQFVSDPSGMTIPIGFLVELLTFRWSPAFAPTRWHHVTWYLGDVALVLGAAGVLIASKRQRFFSAFWATIACLSILLIAGESLGFVPNLVYRLVDSLPLINGALRRSFRFVAVFALSLSVLSGLGAAALSRLLTRERQWAQAILTLGMAGLVVIDFYPHWGSFRVLPAYLRDDEQAVINWLAGQDDRAHRYLMFFNNSVDEKGYLLGYNLSFAHHTWPQPGVWNDSYITHFLPRRSVDLVAAANEEHPLQRRNTPGETFPLLELSSIRYLVLFLDSPSDLALYDVAVAQGLPELFASGQARVIELPQAKSLVQFYPHSALYTGSDLANAFADLLPRLYNAGYALIEPLNPSTQPVLETDLSIATKDELAQLTVAAPPSQATYEWSMQAPGTFHVQIDTPEPGVLVLGSAWFPGWHVEVDGVEQPLLRANYAFLGVPVEDGVHRIHFAYRPPLYILACYWVSGLVFFGAVILLLFGARFFPQLPEPKESSNV